MKKYRRFFQMVALILVCAIVFLPSPANAADLQGWWGKLRYELNGTTLTLSGSGEMPHREQSDAVPWTWSGVDYYIISEGITNIGDFRGSYVDHPKVSIPTTVTQIDDLAFHDFTLENGVSDVILEYAGNLEEINSIAINGRNNLLSYPSEVIAKDYTFKYGGPYTYPGKSHIGVITSITDIHEEMTFPDSVLGLPVTAISALFYESDIVKKIVLPDSVDYIYQDFCRDCSNLESVQFSKSLKEIALYAFMGCSNLQRLSFPASLNKIRYGAFDSCTGITDVYYAGTRSDWENITIEPNNDCLLSARIHCSDDVPVSSVALNKTSSRLNAGDTELLTASVYPQNATYTGVVWSSSNKSVATVKDGLVTAISAGTATITVTTEDGAKTASCAVSVFPVAGLQVGSITSNESGETLTWTCSETGKVSVTTENLPQGEAVLAAGYDVQGKLLGVQMLTCDKQSGVLNGDFAKVKFFWLDDKQKPLADSVTVGEG